MPPARPNSRRVPIPTRGPPSDSQILRRRAPPPQPGLGVRRPLRRSEGSQLRQPFARERYGKPSQRVGATVEYAAISATFTAPQHERCSCRRTDQGSGTRGRRASLALRSKHARRRIPCSQLLGRVPGQRCWRNSPTVRPMSPAMRRNRMGEMSRPTWKGTVVARPSACRNCLWEPFWRTSSKPSCSRSLVTSRGFRTGISPTVTQRW